MATTVQLIGVVSRPDGRVDVYWSNGEVQYYPSLDELKQVGAEMDTRPDIAQILLIRWWLARNPDASNPNLVVGKRLTFDLSAPQPIRVQ